MCVLLSGVIAGERTRRLGVSSDQALWIARGLQTPHYDAPDLRTPLYALYARILLGVGRAPESASKAHILAAAALLAVIAFQRPSAALLGGFLLLTPLTGADRFWGAAVPSLLFILAATLPGLSPVAGLAIALEPRLFPALVGASLPLESVLSGLAAACAATVFAAGSSSVLRSFRSVGERLRSPRGGDFVDPRARALLVAIVGVSCAVGNTASSLSMGGIAAVTIASTSFRPYHATLVAVPLCLVLDHPDLVTAMSLGALLVATCTAASVIDSPRWEPVEPSSLRRREIARAVGRWLADEVKGCETVAVVGEAPEVAIRVAPARLRGIVGQYGTAYSRKRQRELASDADIVIVSYPEWEWSPDPALFSSIAVIGENRVYRRCSSSG